MIEEVTVVTPANASSSELATYMYVLSQRPRLLNVPGRIH